MMNVAKRKLRLKDTHNNLYDADEILELLKSFEDKDSYEGALAFVCSLLGIRPERILTVFEYVGY